jgi:hypothetical protein
VARRRRTLADIGYWMIEPAHCDRAAPAGLHLADDVSVGRDRRAARAIALDASAPPPVREQAIWTLGYRQRARCTRRRAGRARRAARRRSARSARRCATTAGKVASEKLPLAMRHVQWEGASAVFARAPGLWGEAIECFGSPALARVLLVCLEDIPPQHRLRAIRLVGAVLGEEACRCCSRAPARPRSTRSSRCCSR